MAHNTYQHRSIHSHLLNKCKEGDKKTQYKIYTLYYKAMYNTSLRIVKNRSDAEDIMQESFLSAFEKINMYIGDVSFGAWLKKIVINKSIDLIKKRKIEFEPLQHSDTYSIEKESTYNDDETKEKIEKIKQAIRLLPDGYRIVVSLYLFEGYDHDEIAQILNITNSASRSQYTRARQKILTLLKKQTDLSPYRGFKK